MRVKGLFHIHSNFSDGELSLKELKKEAQKLGMNFILLADHFYQIGGREKFEELLKECQLISSDKFLIIPGFEIEFKEGYHLLVYNVKNFFGNRPSLKEVVESPADKDCLLILAHSSQFFKRPPQEILDKVDGLEVWNARYDSRFAPNLKSLKWIDKNLVAFIGSDAHGYFGLKKLWAELEIEKFEEREIINCLKRGQFKVSNGLFSIDLKEPLNFFQYFFFKTVNFCYAPIRFLLVSLSKKGLKYPKFLKKIFHKFY